MRVEYHPLTASDLNEAATFYNDKQPGLGDMFRAEVYSAIDRIRANPRRFRVVAYEKRRCRVDRFPYSVIFRIVDDSLVRILVIRHHRQRPEFGVRRG